MLQDKALKVSAIFLFVASLVLLSISLVISVPRISSAGKAVQYKVVKLNSQPYETQALQAALDKYGTDGWELVEFEKGHMHLIFKR